MATLADFPGSETTKAPPWLLQFVDRALAEGGAKPLAGLEVPPLPKVEAPSLKGLQVKIQPPPEVSEEAAAAVLDARLDDLRYEHASRRALAEGEAVSLGDDVVLDVVIFADGRYLPFSAWEDYETVLAEDSIMDGVGKVLAGNAVGETVAVQCAFPDDDPRESLRGVPAAVVAAIKEAYELEAPGADDAAFLRAAGRGDSLDEVLSSLADEVADELSDDVESDIREAILDALVERAAVDVPMALIDAEIRQRWYEGEGTFLESQGFGEDVQADSLQGWLEDPVLLGEVETELARSAVVTALAAKLGFALSREEVAMFVVAQIEALGGEVKEPGKQTPEDLKDLYGLIRQYSYLRAVDEIVAHAEYEIVESRG